MNGTDHGQLEKPLIYGLLVDERQQLSTPEDGTKREDDDRLRGKSVASVHQQFRRWLAARDRAGWPSLEMRAAAFAVTRCLWVCRSNPNTPTFVRGLAQSVAALEMSMSRPNAASPMISMPEGVIE